MYFSFRVLCSWRWGFVGRRGFREFIWRHFPKNHCVMWSFSTRTFRRCIRCFWFCWRRYSSTWWVWLCCRERCFRTTLRSGYSLVLFLCWVWRWASWLNFTGWPLQICSSRLAREHCRCLSSSYSRAFIWNFRLCLLRWRCCFCWAWCFSYCSIDVHVTAAFLLSFCPRLSCGYSSASCRCSHGFT